jgi:copper chaperone CopZ
MKFLSITCLAFLITAMIGCATSGPDSDAYASSKAMCPSCVAGEECAGCEQCADCPTCEAKATTGCAQCEAGEMCEACQAEKHASCADCRDGEKCEACKAEREVRAAPAPANVAVIDAKGMSCPLCASNADRRLMKLDGVEWTRIDLGAGKVEVGLSETGDTPDAEQLKTAVRDAGFTAEGVTMPGEGSDQ